MSSPERKSRPSKDIPLENLGPGIRGREIPPEEFQIKEDKVREFAKSTGSSGFAEFLFKLYKIEPREGNRDKGE